MDLCIRCVCRAQTGPDMLCDSCHGLNQAEHSLAEIRQRSAALRTPPPAMASREEEDADRFGFELQ